MRGLEMTPSELVRRLADHGYEATERKLTDWRQKGLLPPLQPVSRGRSGGIGRYWDEPDIVERAVFISERLQKTSSADECIYALFLAGFRVEPEALKEAWGRRLERQQRRIEASLKRNRGRIPPAAKRSIESIDAENFAYKVNKTSLLDALVELYNLWSDQYHEIDATDFAVIISEFLYKSVDQDLDKLIERFMPNLTETVSNFRMIRTVMSASLIDIDTLSGCLSNLRSVCIRWASLQPGAKSDQALARFALEAWKVYGPPLAAIGLQLATANRLKPMAEIVSLMADWVATLDQADFIASDKGAVLTENAMRSFQPCRRAIAQIWEERLA